MADFQQSLPWFEIVIFIGERAPILVAAWIGLLLIVRGGKSVRFFLAFLPVIIFFGLVALVMHESKTIAAQEGYDMSLPTVRQALEVYIETGEGDMHDILEGKKHPPIFSSIELNRYLRSQLLGTWWHNTEQDAAYLPEAYNKGDDWFEATLGEPMVYTSAIYTGPNETMWSAQLNKLDFIAHALGVKPGDKALEIGAGWGRLANHLASKGADVTGVVMASDQQAYGTRLSKSLANEKKVEIKLKNFFELENPPKSFNVISAVEMAEHVGIRNYHTFLKKVHSLLADDGTFYIQVAPPGRKSAACRPFVVHGRP
jgi:hypothetical protein